MKVKLVCIGAVKDGAIETAIAKYSKRIPYYWPFTAVYIPDVKSAKSAGTEAQKELEGERILGETSPGDFVVLLDERGRELTSREFSEFISKKALELPRSLVFVIGGPYGFSKAVYARADMLLSLSKMTFPHELARLFFVEQIYRAGTIAKGEPYHHD